MFIFAELASKFGIPFTVGVISSSPKFYVPQRSSHDVPTS